MEGSRGRGWRNRVPGYYCLLERTVARKEEGNMMVRTTTADQKKSSVGDTKSLGRTGALNNKGKDEKRQGAFSNRWACT